MKELFKVFWACIRVNAHGAAQVLLLRAGHQEETVTEFTPVPRITYVGCTCGKVFYGNPAEFQSFRKGDSDGTGTSQGTESSNRGGQAS